MSVRAPHGNAARLGSAPRVEVLEPRRLPVGVQAPGQAGARAERDEGGRFRKGASTIQSAGGRALRHRVRLAAELGLEDLLENPSFAPYVKAAEDFARAQCAYLAGHIGGGVLGPDVQTMVMSAAWQSSVSRYFLAMASKTADVDLFAKASRLANESRQNLLACHELAAKAAKARPTVSAPFFVAPSYEDDAPHLDKTEPPTEPAEGLPDESTE
jgi:hypothetical protein